MSRGRPRRPISSMGHPTKFFTLPLVPPHHEQDSTYSLPIFANRRLTFGNCDTREHALNITEREHDVIHCLSKGLTNKEIGQQLGISQHTVRDHLSSVFKKLNISSRIELAILVNTSRAPTHNA